MEKIYYLTPDEKQGIIDEQESLGLSVYSEHTDFDGKTAVVFMTSEESQIIAAEEARRALSATDAGMGRVTEDLIDLLISKQTITPEELPSGAQEKLAARKSMREIIATQ